MFSDLLELVRVARGHFALALHGNSLQVLGAHNRPEAAGAAGVVVGEDDGVGDEILPGGAAGDDGEGAAQLALECFAGLDRVLAPEGGGVSYLYDVVLDEQIDWRVRFTLDHQTVVPGELELPAPPAAEVAVRELLRGHRGGLAADLPPGAGKPAESGQRPGGEDHPVLRIEGADVRWHLVPVDLGRDPPAAEEPAGVLRGRRVADTARRQVDPEDLSGVSVLLRHSRSLPLPRTQRGREAD